MGGSYRWHPRLKTRRSLASGEAARARSNDEIDDQAEILEPIDGEQGTALDSVDWQGEKLAASIEQVSTHPLGGCRQTGGANERGTYSGEATVGERLCQLVAVDRQFAITITLLNTAAAESQIRDVDFASETAELTRNQVLQPAGVSVLGQANISTRSALSLLG
jgi:hypothetical protein